MNLIEIIFLAGTHCVSPLQSGDGITEVGKVACAVVVKQDPQTATVKIFPDTAATDPKVIAVLGSSVRMSALPAPVIRIVPTAYTSRRLKPLLAPSSVKVVSKPAETVPAPQARKVKAKKSQDSVGLKVGTKRPAVRKLRDQCGSYRAVWYTNKEGRRKYRCVRS